VHTRRLLALVLFFAHLVNQVLAQVVIGHAELLPPVGQHFVHLTGIGTQAHKVKRSTKTLLARQAKGGTANALFEPGLHHPNLAHITGQLATA
jgi:hypothetical protein